MKRNHWRAAVGAFIVTVIAMTGWIGCLVADSNTARMTFGNRAEPLQGTDETWSSMAQLPSWAYAFVPVRFRAAWWFEQLERDTIAYWLR